MNFPMWPEYYRTRALEWQDKKFEARIFFCVGIGSWIPYLLFRWDIFLLPGLLLPFFAFIMFARIKRERDNVLLSIRIGENAVDVMDTSNDIRKSVEYRYIHKMEIREIQISQSPKNSRYQGEPINCKLIFLYIDGTYNFSDLNLREYLIRRGQIYYMDEDVFFHPGCIALAYDDDAWELLSRKIS